MEHQTSILRLTTVRARTGLSRSGIYAGMREGTFPKSISLGARAVGWLSTDVEAWIDARVRAAKAARKSTPQLAATA